MTLEVVSSNSGIAMGNASVGGGGSSGVLYEYKGSVATYAALLALDTTQIKPGWVYDVLEDGMDYAWTGTVWNSLGPRINLSNYYNKPEVNSLLDGKADVEDIPDLSSYYNKSEVNNLLDGKADIEDVPDVSDYYTKSQIDTSMEAKQELIDGLTTQVTTLETNINGGNA